MDNSEPMTKEKTKFNGITKSVVEQFFDNFNSDEVSEEVKKRLRQLILVDGKTSEKALSKAMFDDD